jgi:glycine/D-amino acid oxidase-like deaminating enzyme
MKIAIVGAGFCGLACSWYLVNAAQSVTLFDRIGIGAGASGVPSGLLHGYAGPKATLSWQAEEAYADAVSLLETIGASSSTPLFYRNGILRPVTSGLDANALQETAKRYSDTEWWEIKKCREFVPALLDLPGLFIRSGIVVDCPLYLRALWNRCQSLGAQFVQAEIYHPGDLKEFDQIIFTVGSGQINIRELNAPMIALIKGQTLELEWQNDEMLPFALNAGVQFSQITKECAYAGATYERRWTTLEPDLASASEIRHKLALMSPTFSQLPMNRIWTGARAATKDKKPFISRSSDTVWTLGGMGSKGLLYHAWLAKKLTSQLLPYA